jgi:hypothetical protein
MSNKKVFNFGCSFTQNFRQFGIEELFSDFEYHNHARESASNFYIFDKFNEYAEPNYVCIIQWSSLTRPMDENFSLLESSNNVLFDLLEQWYELLEKTKEITKKRKIKLIQFVGWAVWKDKELNNYHREKLKSYDIIWYESEPQCDLIDANCFQFETPTIWSSDINNEGLFYWDKMHWGGMAEWVRENVELEKRYVGHDLGSEHFDCHPSKHASIEFIKKVLLPKINE